MNQELQFGQMITIRGRAFKYRVGNRTCWGHPKCTPEKVLCIGKRVVHEGETVIKYSGDWEVHEVERYWKHSKSHVVFLVVRNMRENPFYVFPDQIVTEEIEVSA